MFHANITFVILFLIKLQFFASLIWTNKVATAFSTANGFSPSCSFKITTTTEKKKNKSCVGVVCQAIATPVSTIDDSSTGISSAGATKALVLENIASSKNAGVEYSDMFGLSSADAAFYSLFAAIKNSNIPLGLKGEPFMLRSDNIVEALGSNKSPFCGFFTLEDLEKATEDDFLDASRGSTDNRKGWQTTSVGEPSGESFEEARMSFGDVQNALDKGTVILNAAGAHIPKLAGPSLACSDATSLPNALNLYVTAAGKRTSAPPHTDRQDVVVVQTSGCKHWRVYAPLNPAHHSADDIFARGKGDDSLPQYLLNDEGELLLEMILNEGDILFIPAGFPHTTSTANNNIEGKEEKDLEFDKTSVHLTFNIESHVWDLTYLNARRYALNRAGVRDTALVAKGSSRGDNTYESTMNTRILVNKLPEEIYKEIFEQLPLGFLEDDDTSTLLMNKAKSKLEQISHKVDESTASQVDPQIWEETVERIRQYGMELLDIHRDMYLAAIEEGREREAEEAMTAHLQSWNKKAPMTQDRIQRLSLFRVKPFYDKVGEIKESLNEWSKSGLSATADAAEKKAELPENWEFTIPLKVGDKVDADLGGAFFEATVTRVAGVVYDVQFFDGDRDFGLERSMLKLLTPPFMEEEDEVNTSHMTKKQLKRWKKDQEKKKKER